MALPEGDCVIQENDPRLAGQPIAFLLNSMKCRMRVNTERRSSIYETDTAPSKYTVVASLAVTEQQIILDVKRIGKDQQPIQYFCVNYQDPLFNELGLEFSNDKRNSHLVFSLPDAARFLGASAADAGVEPRSTVRVYMSTFKAPDVAMYVNHILAGVTGGFGIDCVIQADDPRLSGQQVLFLLNNMKCQFQLDTERRSSVSAIDMAAGPSHTYYAALAVTETGMLLDLTRVKKGMIHKDCLTIPYQSELSQGVDVSFENDARTSHLCVVLPSAGRFLTQSTGELRIPELSTVKVFMDAWQAPDIAMLVKQKLPVAGDCIIGDQDPRLAGQKVAFLLNSMKCKMQIDTDRRSSVYETADAPSRHTVFAALAVTDQFIILDVKRQGKDDAPNQYLCIPYQNPLCKEVGIEFSNDERNSHLVIVLPYAARFLGAAASELGVGEQSTVKVFIDTWKAPDICMHVKQKIRLA